jgi:hypothetical protein
MMGKRSANQTNRYGSYVARTFWDPSTRYWISEVVMELAHQTKGSGPSGR